MCVQSKLKQQALQGKKPLFEKIMPSRKWQMKKAQAKIISAVWQKTG